MKIEKQIAYVIQVYIWQLRIHNKRMYFCYYNLKIYLKAIVINFSVIGTALTRIVP